jgi:type II secretory pathway pseudopilin PulG
MADRLQLDERQRVAAAAGAEDEGYMLLGLIVAIALLLLWLGVAATNVAFAIRRDREVETARRADQYVRAIRLYYKKFGHYPGSVDQLEKSNNIRFLRRKWVDPLTGTTDWRLISVGQNKTTVKGFFGEPLAGLPTTGLGALAGSQSAGMPGSPAAAGAPAGPGGLGAGGLGAGIGTLGSPAAGTAAPAGAAAGTGTAAPTGGSATAAAGGTGTAATGTTATGTTATGTTAATGTGGTTSPFGSGNGLGGTNGAIMGVGTNASGNSILELNEQTDYQSWEFLYDPRLELLRQKQQLNQGIQTNGAGSFGQAPTGAGGFGPAPTTTPGGNQQTTPGGTTPAPPSAPTVGVPVQP